MLHAQRRGAFKRTYEITDDGGGPVTTWSPSGWGSSGEFALDGTTYTVRTSGWGGQRAELTDKGGHELATADRVGRKTWTIDTGGRSYSFERASLFRGEQVLVADGERVGSVRPVGRWRGGAEADLPGLPTPVAMFALAVVLMMWERSNAAAASA